ncbi:dipeptidase [Blastomonas fulva]|jgi:membrane dipeptidase|uniref:dipeptidase n=1 Tax=Blastomonas fulva TaxID=1550728 RepID=UPI003F720EB7
MMVTQLPVNLEDWLVWDNHGCLPLRPFDTDFLPQLARYRQAGVDVAIVNIGFGDHGIEDHIRMIANFRHWLKQHPESYVLIATVDDIERARREGKLAIAFNMEGANGVADQPSLISLYYDLGVRWMLMAYNRANRVGSGCHEDEDRGLTAFGRIVLDEMARVGMVACCSHTGHRTTMDVMHYASRPVIFSHSNPRALHDHPRNIRDEAMRACAATKGVVGINGIGIFLGQNDNSTETFVRHVDYAVQLIGAEHVGLGLDYVFDAAELDDYLVSMASTFPEGFSYQAGMKMIEPERLSDIVEALVKLGYPEAAIGGILGGNFMRVARDVWRPA